MSRAFRFALSATSRYVSSRSANLSLVQGHSVNTTLNKLHTTGLPTSRTNCTLSAILTKGVHKQSCCCSLCSKKRVAFYSTEVDKEISKFLEKEIQYENSRASQDLPKVLGFDVQTDGGDITLTKTTGLEKVVVRLSVNGAVDSIMSENAPENTEEPPQMVCRPPFEVEITKGSGDPVLALQCTFPSADQMFEEKEGSQTDQIDDQFEIQEVAIHGGEWKDSTFSVSAATMDAELFDLLMDMLDERGINDEFIAHLVDLCTAYENKQYIGFLQSLKSFVEK